ncbi:MAG: polyphenol oxidase family protein [Alphaproteobacteria bacterium]|nr:polyphenol oxidase family protein [Alphaproteobacteria bacterium]
MDSPTARRASDDPHKTALFHTASSLVPDNAPVFHGFFGRQGGVSKDVYNALNCGPGSDDDIDRVQENLEIVAEAAGVKAQSILLLHQVHGSTCLKVDAPWSIHGRPQADAMVTDKPGLGLGILTADCAPVLFCGRKGDGSPVVGAAHAGWKGALGGILESTVE